MANATVKELRKKNETAWLHLGRQLEGMDTHLERADAPGQWTAREVDCHLLFEPGWKAAALLERFAVTDLPVVDITPGVATVTPERRRMTLGELTGALDAQRRQVFAYLETLGEADPGAMFDRHWSGRAEQLAKICQAAGLPETK